jgi:tryptophanyl-tRNA synthetase
MNIYSNLNKSLCEIFDVQYNPNEYYGEPDIIPMFGPVCGELHPMYGLKHSQESRKQMSESAKRVMNLPEMKKLNSKLQKIAQSNPIVVEKKKKSNSWRSKPVYGWHPEFTNNQKVVYQSIRDFCHKTGTNRSVVNGILLGKYKQSFGWCCEYII